MIAITRPFPVLRAMLPMLVAAAFSLAGATATAAEGTGGTAARPANLVVEAVQMPAWIEREGGEREPVSAGMEVRPSDRLRTGAGSRLLLRTRDGSSVKLGENATFRFGGSEQRRGNVFAATMQVLEGAFRFTTDALAKYRGKREITIQVANVTAGVRGTDLWGKSSPMREIVCLIEGRIEVAPQNEAALTLDQPLQFFQRENGASQPLAMVAPEQLKLWAAETEISAGRGAARRGGAWQVTLLTVDTQAEALEAYDRLREAGYPVRIRPVQVGGKADEQGAKSDAKAGYALRMGGLPSRADAQALAASLKGRFGVENPRVSR